MPITIKTGAMKYKKPNGEYDGFNAIAQESTDQQLASIQAAGAAQVSAVQQKGVETLESIPDDYTELSGNVADLRSALEQKANIGNNSLSEFSVSVTGKDVDGVNYATGVPNWLYDATENSINLPFVLLANDALYAVFGDDVDVYDITNCFDKNSWTPNKIYNDSGNIVDDATSGYLNRLIPVVPDGYIYTSIQAQRVYCFDADGNFLRREQGLGVGKRQLNLQNDTVFIMLQYSIANVTGNLDSGLISFYVSSSEPEASVTTYAPFSAGNVEHSIFQGKRNMVMSKTSSTCMLKRYTPNTVYESRKNALFPTINIWEPTTADSGYSNPTSGWGRDTKRADWTATDKYLYYQFLAHYYDTYLGTYNNGYTVKKRSLGQDSAHTGHELFEYDFCPINYKYTVLLSAGMNADETQGIWGLATFIRCLMNDEEANIKIMHDNIRFKVIPIINASGFDESTLRYNYADGTNPNYNFNYIDSWYNQQAQNKGAYPDSDVATQYIKKWINDNNGADLWLDLHTGRWVVPGDTNTTIIDIRVADQSMVSPFSDVYTALIKSYYVSKGYITSDDYIGTVNVMRSNNDYQKIVYAFDNCKIKSIMPEMHLESTGYGSDGYTNNTVNGIKCYVAQIRAMIMCYINDSTESSYVLDSLATVKYHARYN